MSATNRQHSTKAGTAKPESAKAGSRRAEAANPYSGKASSTKAGPTKAETELRARIQSLVTGLGFEIEEVRVTRVGRRTLVKLVVDADEGVELDDIADVSRAVDAHLDADDPFSGAFVLEVSSPGVDRPLTEPRHWRRNAGRLVEVSRDGAPMTARIVSADDAGVTFDSAGSPVTVGYGQLGSGRVQIEFNRPAAAVVDAQEG